MQNILKKSLIFVAVSLSYFVLGYFGLQLAMVNGCTSPFWPASGLAIGALIYFGHWLTPAIFIGSFLTDFTLDTTLGAMITSATGNTLESYVGSHLIIWGLRKNYFKNYSEVFNVFFVSATASLISAGVGVFSLYHAGTLAKATIPYSLFTWWSGNAIGILLILPFFLELVAIPKEHIELTPKKCLTVLVLCLLMIVVTYFVFVKGFNQAFSWSITPFLMIVGMLFGRLFSRIFLIFISLLIIAITLNGHGPFELGNLNTNLLYIQSLLTSYAIAILFIKPLNTKYRISSKYIIGCFFGWIILFVVIYQTAVFEKELRMEDLDKSTQLAIHTINRMNTRYESILQGAASLFKIKDHVTQEDFAVYTSAIEMSKFYDATYGLAFMQKVSKKDLPAFLKKEGLTLKLFDKKISDSYDHHFIIKLTEPLEKRRSTLGLDLGSDEVRRFAINEAIKKNDITSTGIINLILDAEKRNAFLVLCPVKNAKDELVGFVYEPVIASVFFSKSFDQFSHHLRARVSRNGSPIYTTNQSLKEEFVRDPYYRSKTVTLFGVKHQIEFYPTDYFFNSHSGSSAALAMLLNIFMLFISAFLLEQLTFSQQAESLVEERTRELELSKMQLINSSKMASLGEMASGVAHEINNPLAIIQGKVSVITMILQDLEIKHPMLFQEVQKIKLTTDRIEKIVKGLRNFSRASNNDPFEETPLQKILNETLDLCQEKFKASGIKLRIHDIPDVSILCRPSQISQVFINLLNNSSDAIEQLDDKWIEISFQKRDGNRFSVFFTDSGRGIPTEHLEKIMEPFFTTKEVRKGTGLGLSIAKSIMDSHKGLLWVDKFHPHTRFVVDLLVV